MKRKIGMALFFFGALCFSCSKPTEIPAASANETLNANEITYEDETYYLLSDGLYVNHLPGFYQDGVDLKFHLTSLTGRLFYSLKADPFPKTSDYLYQNETIHLSKVLPTTLEEIPLSASVDAWQTRISYGKCYSADYVENIQKTGNYRFFTGINVVSIDYENGETTLKRSLSYAIDSQKPTLPIVSLSAPYADFFGKEGFYNGIDQEIEKRVNLEYFDPSGESFYRNSKIKLGGNWSLGYPQRTLNLNFAKDENGKKNKAVTTAIFPERKEVGFQDKPLTDFTRFRLHDGGNCFEDFTGFNDALLQNLMAGTHVATTAYRPCLGYLNGEYWGLYAIREHYSDVYLEQNFGVNKDNVIMYELQGGYSLDEGKEKVAAPLLNEFLLYLKNDFTNATIYQTFIDQYLDIDSFIDMVIAQSFGCNWDFIGNLNNLRLWRSVTPEEGNDYADERWRFCLHDADFAFTSDVNYLSKNVANSYNLYDLFAKLMTSRRFRNAFYQRAKVLLASNLSLVNCRAMILAMKAQVKPYRKESYYRWGKSLDYASTWETNVTNTYNYFTNRCQNYVSELTNTMNEYGGIDL